jgi:argininosuccinate lyase
MTKKLWGGRFDKETDPLVEKFTKSIQFDYKLAKYDVLGSILHTAVLAKAGYLTQPEAESLTSELNKIYDEIKKGKFEIDDTCEDIHTNIQNVLENKLGDVALKLHMARSRNDQVVYATKLFCKMNIAYLQVAIISPGLNSTGAPQCEHLISCATAILFKPSVFHV